MSALSELLEKVAAGRPVVGLGLMSGTSADGLDLALVGFSAQNRPRLLAARTCPYPLSVRRKLLEFQSFPQISPEKSILLSRFLGEAWALATKKFLRQSNAGPPDFIASHGQTIRHVSRQQNFLGRRLQGSWQLGEADVLAKRLNAVVISDFRAGDVSLGGSGAPLMPYVHQYLFATPKKVRAILNIGGIANLTFLGKKRFWASDTGPGNCLADVLSQKFYRLTCDPGGKKARLGKVSPALLTVLKENRFFARPFPKSTGREDFSWNWLAKVLGGFENLSRPDILATVETLTAWGAAEAVRRRAKEKLDEVCLAGGGARNLFFTEQLQNFLPGVYFYPVDRLGVPADFLEALGFAVLGWWCLSGRAVGEIAVTGAKKRGVLGKISQP